MKVAQTLVEQAELKQYLLEKRNCRLSNLKKPLR